MDVLQLHNRYRHRGGEDVVVGREAELLRAAGHHVVTHHVENPADGPGAGRDMALAVWNPLSYRGIRAAAAESGAEVAHVHNTWFTMSPSAIDALARTGIPIVMSLHNYRLTCLNGLLLRDGAPCTLCVGTGPAAGVKYKCYRDSRAASAVAAATLSFNRRKRTWDRVDVFLANSEFVRDRYVDAGIDPESIHLKPNFSLDPGPRPRGPEDSDTVLYVGRLSAEKGAAFLAELWSRHPVPGMRLRVIGGGPLLEELRRDHPDIDFAGPKSSEEIGHEMLRARALLFPSLAYETNPLSIIEAFASGMPVMATDRGAMREMVEPLGGHWLRRPVDAEDWHEGLRGLADDELVATSGRWARKAYDESYTGAIALERLETAYQRAMA